MPSDQSIKKFFKSKGVDTEAGRKDWYDRSTAFWEGKEASIDGVMNKITYVAEPDVSFSIEFLDHAVSVLNKRIDEFNEKETAKSDDGSTTSDKTLSAIELGRAAEVGAGVGRISRGVLIHKFKEIDLYEPIGKFVEEAKSSLGSLETEVQFTFTQQTLQDFDPVPNSYDCIWAQWCLMYLTDDDFVKFMNKCAIGLKPNGLLIVKENTIPDTGLFADEADGLDAWDDIPVVFEEADNSVLRRDSHHRSLFKKSHMSLFLASRQIRWPSNLIPVMMYGLKNFKHSS